MKKIILFISFIILKTALPQTNSFIKLPFDFSYEQLTFGKILTLSPFTKDTLQCYYSIDNYYFYSSTSYNKGKDWSEPQGLGSWKSFDVFIKGDKKIISYHLLNFLVINIIDATGDSTEKRFQMPSVIKNLQIRKIENGIGVFYSAGNNIFAYKSDDLIIWSLPDTVIYSGVESFQILQLKNGKYFLVYTKPDDQNLYYTFSDDMVNWQESKILVRGISESTKFVAEQNAAGEIMIAYTKDVVTPFPAYIQKDIMIISSANYGDDWNAATSITKFKGYDDLLSLSASGDSFILSFLSKRESEFSDYYFGFLPPASDRFTPPFVYELNADNSNYSNKNQIKFYAMIDDDEPLKYAKLKIRTNNALPFEILMNDYGIDGDERGYDKIYSAALNRKFSEGDAIVYSVMAEDLSGNTVTTKSKTLFIPIDYTKKVYLFENNRFKLSIGNNGELGYTDTINIGYYDNHRILFSGGFLITGFENGRQFENAIYASQRIYDYRPGIVGGSDKDPQNKIYVIKANDPPFGESWQQYKYATLLNAPYYDGDFNGVYEPVDKNKNGVWDEDEDAPEILGDVTTWCVFNDAVPQHLRRTMSGPVGIEIQQSVFSFDKNSNNQPDEKIYIRYRIINRGTVSSVFDSVLFSFVVDPDIGENYQNDYMATDTTLNLVYAYSQRETDFGTNPPAVGVALLQGPPVFIAGETFIDNNNDGIFQSDIDLAIDTAVYKNASLIPAEKIPGAKNGNIIASCSYLMYYREGVSYRNYQKGLNIFGNPIDVCNNNFSTVFGNYNCYEINPIYHFSGNPVIPDGWVITMADDVFFFSTVGYFQLIKDKPVDIWGVYVAGRGIDSLNSISKMTENVLSAIDFYKNFPVNKEREKPIISIPDEYRLFQNYPNPFNSGTKIKFMIPKTENVKLRLYDITGREVVTLVNEVKTPGEYEVLLKSDNLASGIYFYQLVAGNFISTKKCVLIK